MHVLSATLFIGPDIMLQVQQHLVTGCALHAEANLGGALQLLVDLQYIAGALSPLAAPSHEAVVTSARELILGHVVGMLGAASGSGSGSNWQSSDEGERLQAWLQGVEVRACQKKPSFLTCMRMHNQPPLSAIVGACTCTETSTQDDAWIGVAIGKRGREVNGRL